MHWRQLNRSEASRKQEACLRGEVGVSERACYLGVWRHKPGTPVGSKGLSGDRLGSSGIQELKVDRRVGPDATGRDLQGRDGMFVTPALGQKTSKIGVWVPPSLPLRALKTGQRTAPRAAGLE